MRVRARGKNKIILVCLIGKNVDEVIGNCIFSYLMYMRIC